MRRYFSLALLVSMLAQTVFAAEPGVTMRYDPNKPTRETSIFWLGYLIARTAYREEHKLPLSTPGELRPTFQEEIHGRTIAIGAYRDLKQKDHGPVDPYWEKMSEVEAHHFMEAYVWTFHRRPEWSVREQPKNLLAFETWRRTALRGHAPQTYGWLEGGGH